MALDGGLDADFGDDEERGPLPLPVVVGGLAAVVVAVLVGVFLLRPTLGVGADDQTAAPQPTAASSSRLAGPTPSAGTGFGTATVPPVLPSLLVDPPSTTPPTSSSTTSTLGGDAAVVVELQAIRDRDLGRVRFEGQWVAQLAAKYFGIVDPLQTTASGSHTFMPADVLAEYRQLRQRFGDRVVLLLGTDHSPRVTAPSGARLWVTSYTGRFRSDQEVQDWCRRAYPSLSGRALANQCVPRRFTP